jgi:hypothetical protein
MNHCERAVPQDRRRCPSLGMDTLQERMDPYMSLDRRLLNTNRSFQAGRTTLHLMLNRDRNKYFDTQRNHRDDYKLSGMDCQFQGRLLERLSYSCILARNFIRESYGSPEETSSGKKFNSTFARRTLH